MLKRIYLTWQPHAHEERLLIGELIQMSNQEYSFQYVQGSELEKAKHIGFKGYPAFPDLTKVYNINVIESFEMRLPAREREDFLKLLERWEIKDSSISSFDLLAITGGQLPTDYFEFIDPHDEMPPTEFLSEIAGFVYHCDDKCLRGLAINTELNLEREPANKYDKFAVKVSLSGKQLGYIKKIHSWVVSKAITNDWHVSAKIRRIDANGIVNAIVIKINIFT